MNCCKSDQCRGIEEIFDDSMAAGDLAQYHRAGPSKPTSQLLDAIRSTGAGAETLLDIGGGVGAIQHELAPGLAAITNVDASPAYSRAAHREAATRGYADRAAYYVGDFVELADRIDGADIVTLDRVLCCYDDMPGLVDAAVRKTGRILGLVYPVDRFGFRIAVAIVNGFQRITRKPFRIFLHDPRAVDARIRAAGFRQETHHKGFFWQVAVYAK
jgi:magnesium-protoporphyrin O-methyltransferase